MTAPSVPVVFIHGLWIHSDAWQPWVELYRTAGYNAMAPGWPGDSASVDDSRKNPAAVAGKGIDAGRAASPTRPIQAYRPAERPSRKAQPKGPAERHCRKVQRKGTAERHRRASRLGPGAQLVRRNAPMAAMESSCVVIV